MLFLHFLIFLGPIVLLFGSGLVVGAVEVSGATNRKLTYEIVVKYLKKINLKICTILVDEEQMESPDEIPSLSFIKANIYVKVTQDIETVFIDHFGAVQALILSLESNNSSNVLKMASNEGLFNASFHWILTGTNLDTNAIDKWLNRLNIHVDSKMTVVNLFHNGETKQGHQQVSFYDIWKPSHRHDPKGKVNINLLSYGVLSSHSTSSSSLSSSSKSKQQKPLIYFNEPASGADAIFPVLNRMEQRRNMSAITVRVMTVIQQNIREPFELYLKHTYNRHLDTMHRLNVAILEVFREMFNLTFHMKRTRSWGYPVNDTWDGMVGNLIRGDADIGGSPIFYYKERQAVVTGVGYTWLERPCFFLLQPYDPNALRNIFLLPFTTNVWICILLCSALFIFVMFLFYNFEHKVTENVEHVIWKPKRIDQAWRSDVKGRGSSHEKPKVHSVNLWTDSLLLLLGAICQQGLEKTVKTSASRCFGLFLLLFGFLIYQFYSASIVGALLMEKPKTIKTLRNLIDSPLELYIDNIIYMKNHFTRTSDPLTIELYNKKIVVFNKKTGQNELHYMPYEEGMRMVRKGVAFHVQDSMAYKVITETFTEREICTLTEIHLLPRYFMTMAAIVRKRSPFRKILAYSMRRITEHGIMARERKFWRVPKPKCVRNLHKEDIQVRVEFIYSVLLFLTGGYVISSGILLVEIFYVKYCNNNHHVPKRGTKNRQDTHTPRLNT